LDRGGGGGKGGVPFHFKFVHETIGNEKQNVSYSRTRVLPAKMSSVSFFLKYNAKRRQRTGYDDRNVVELNVSDQQREYERNEPLSNYAVANYIVSTRALDVPKMSLPFVTVVNAA